MRDTTKEIRLFSHNVAKNYMYLDVLLETLQNSFDVLFVQEPPWRTIRQAPSPNNRDGEDIVGAPMHPAWLYMVRPPTNDETPRVMAFVSKRLERLRPSMRRDLADHRDIFILSLFQGNETYHLMNVYNDADGTAVRYLSNHVHELPQLHYMSGDFNIHSREWDPEVTHHRGDAINLLELAADLDLERTQPSNPGPTFISHNPDLRPSVIDLVFHGIAESASDCTFRDPVRQGPSDHIPIFTVVKLDDEIEPVTRRTIPRDSEAEQAMRTELPQKVADIQVGDLETRGYPNFITWVAILTFTLGTADLDLERTQPSNPGPTFISHNPDLRPSVIDLVFHGIAESASDCTFRDPVRQGPSDHIPIFTVVKLDDEIEPVTRRTIPRDSEAEQAMRTELPQKVADIQVGDLETREDVERVAQALADAYAEAWMAHSKLNVLNANSSRPESEKSHTLTGAHGT
ncbi:hypothetical protein D9613_007683 [Agrocybe pediades]|uniref:Endonuclease/exonuclease/phosphatase domain-containing protein n=1 Tax=Agrocybe pediades TaxID=84607 RepID=A0A8H4QMT6_9AGAR|nr:hypothetical protein D9613_007683 [Agrocybe pediades]